MLSISSWHNQQQLQIVAAHCRLAAAGLDKELARPPCYPSSNNLVYLCSGGCDGDGGWRVVVVRFFHAYGVTHGPRCIEIDRAILKRTQHLTISKYLLRLHFIWVEVTMTSHLSSINVFRTINSKWHTCVCDFHIACHFLCWSSGGATNSPPHVVYTGISRDVKLLPNQSINPSINLAQYRGISLPPSLDLGGTLCQQHIGQNVPGDNVVMFHSYGLLQ